MLSKNNSAFKDLTKFALHDRVLLTLNTIILVNLCTLVTTQILIQYTASLSNDLNAAMLNLIFTMQHAINSVISIAYNEHFPAVYKRQANEVMKDTGVSDSFISNSNNINMSSMIESTNSGFYQNSSSNNHNQAPSQPNFINKV